MILHLLPYTVQYVRQSTVYKWVDIWEKGRQSDDCAGIKEIHLGPTSSEEHSWLSLHSSEDCILTAPYPPTHIHLPAFLFPTHLFPLSSFSIPPSTPSATAATQILFITQHKEADKEKYREEDVGQHTQWGAEWEETGSRSSGAEWEWMRKK